MSEADWTLAPKGATHYLGDGIIDWYSTSGAYIKYWSNLSKNWRTSSQDIDWILENCTPRPEVSCESTPKKHSHYYKDVSHLETIDVYRVLSLFGVESHCVGHGTKKLLCAGSRGTKGYKQDIIEARDSLNRELEMLEENENANN